ncbi:MAG: hypothetical protein A2Y57_04430 [Candidatus Woykebacteria bacterium RBG_13_40_7b]|uniref:tRNA-2-methylthio-N(6)-dimethylallyladenosine synthase n=1 Tax=Candidatus Woykebacteria bacterium RBG_13_40_7b TaxID=1802594 RepID=A0A1G1W7T3_9BACT|nr:MAG: hypothetical protein A2Y57_04430 [Candidatus Woykebacteria bacterium RBG_13_40_7b]
MRRQKYSIITFGCQQNLADSERVAGGYESQGMIEASSLEEADRIVINTCMVRQHAEDKIYGLMKKLGSLKEKNNNLKIILTGCMVGAAVRDKTGKFGKIMRRRLPLVDQFLPIDEVGFDTPARRESKTHAWVVISNGCNNFCSYCIVPYTRGREVSRPMKNILAEVSDLVKQGYSEITLLGQNVNSYGADLIKSQKERSQFVLPNGKKVPPVIVKLSMGRYRIPTLFPYLLEAVRQFKEIKKINFLSSNPWDFSDELIEVIAKNPKISRFIHLPLQSGDNQILKKMNRWYTVEEYKTLVKKLRDKVAGVKISTDLIVGFPGEGEVAFGNTLKLVKEIGFYKAYIFIYSARTGTLSSDHFRDDILREDKVKRLQILDSLINKKVKDPAYVD